MAPNSLNVYRATRSEAAVAAGLTCGQVTLSNTCHLLRPRVLATSSLEASVRTSAAETAKKT